MNDKVIEQSVMIRDTGVKVSAVLGMISQGYSYDQILNALPNLTMGDIMGSADLAGQLVDRLADEHGRVEIQGQIKFLFSNGKMVLLDQVRTDHPRAYKPWSDREDNNLAEAFRHGVEIDQLARKHRRQPGAIRVRIERLGLSRK